MTPVLLLSLALTPVAGPPPATALDVLVRQLGSDNYAIRSAAERRLLALGAAAVPAVEAGRRHDDLEVRRRCEEVLRRLRAAVCAERVKALRAGRAASDAPLWGHYRRMLGSGRAATAQFTDIYQSESDLLEEAALALGRGDHEGVGRLLGQQVRLLAATFADETAGRRDSPALRGAYPHRINAALLLAALPGVELDEPGWTAFARVLTDTFIFRVEAAGRDGRGAARRELIGWACLGARGEGPVLQALRQALLHKLAGPARALALRVLAGAHPMLLASAAYALGRHGESDDVRRLLPLLANEAELSSIFHSDDYTAGEVADYALEALVRLTGQKEGDYGIEPCAFMGIGSIWDDKGLVLDGFPCPLSVFRLQAKREAAFGKWREWAERNHGRLGLPRPSSPAAAPFDPWQGHAAARDAALAGVAGGRRMRNWGTWPEAVSQPKRLVQLRLGPDRVTLADYLGKGTGPRTGMSWGVRVSGLGRSFVGTQHDDAGVATFLLAAVAHDDEAGTVARTTIAQQSGTLTIDFVRRELHETLAVRYAQRSGAILTVKRTRNRDGGVRYAAARSVDTLEQLARDHPCDHALLVSLLKQTNTVERAAAGGN